MTERLEGRNGAIYRAYLLGSTQEAIAESHDITQGRVSQIIASVLAGIPDEDLAARRKRMLDATDVLAQVAAEIMDAPLPPAYSNGRPIRDENDQPVLDAGPRLAGLDRLLKIQERQAKLMGLDAAQKVDVAVSEQARQAAQSAAAEAIARLSTEE